METNWPHNITYLKVNFDHDPLGQLSQRTISMKGNLILVDDFLISMIILVFEKLWLVTNSYL